jgi:hypothetical protein
MVGDVANERCFMAELQRLAERPKHGGGAPLAILVKLSQYVRDVSVNTRVNTSMYDAGIEVRLVCVDCWTGADRAIISRHRQTTIIEYYYIQK